MKREQKKAVQAHSIWITGPTRTGKTTRLVEHLCRWVEGKAGERGRKSPNAHKIQNPKIQNPPLPTSPAVLVFAANGWVELADRIATATQSVYPAQTTTPLRFFRDEVILFWPLLIQQLNLRAQFPLRLRPETEQELATQLWRPELDAGILRQEGVSESRIVRRTLDLLQLAAASGTPVEDVPRILEAGMLEEWEMENGNALQNPTSKIYPCMGELLLRWRSWCLERGLLTYGIICELYWRHLLPDATYQQHLTRRYGAVMADDVDEYPAIARYLFDFLLDQGTWGAFTCNPNGSVRLGLDADPDFLTGLASRCQVETLTQQPEASLGSSLGQPAAELVLSTFTLPPSAFILPESVRSIQTISRAQLLRETAEVIIEGVKTQQVQPQDIALITPGLDAIARYSLIEILNSQGITVESLNEQRPLASSPTVRALLTLLGLVYPGLGRLVDRDCVAEMLVILSRQPVGVVDQEGIPENIPTSLFSVQSSFSTNIDPVRAGLLVDHCFYPDLEQPRLLPVTAFPRWDRLGYRATNAYQEILQWLEMQKSQLTQRLIPGPVSVLDRAIQQFLWRGSNLPYDQLTALRELIDIAQHYWQVDGRLRQIQPNKRLALHETVGEFIQLLRRGTISANPYRPSLWPPGGAITLGTIFQYRFNRRSHRWHFWLDAGSPLWLSSGEALRFGAPLFLKDWPERPWTAEDGIQADESRLQRILLDLLSRAGERLFLCHSELAVNGQEQTGPVLSLVNACVPLNAEVALT
ncbi:recombinase family protein [Microcoleus sp. FACHB-672]|uniref:recombinase family protein n=1 Tax=Microcoleus sp. FACHB-672 TaxID=2692825 RepID=UPI0018EFD7A3|nr:recombinase family protein [Microcoleus sp. FACHB-672]